MPFVSFVRRKFNAMLGVATVTMSVNYIVMLSGSVIVGNLVGPDGLAGVNACTPIFGLASFLASLLSVGSGLVFSRAMGAFDERHARGVWTQSAGLALALGLVIYFAMHFGGRAFLAFTGVTGGVLEQAAAYWRWQTVAMALTPLVLLMEAMVYADGDGAVAAAAGVCHVSGSIGFSVIFTRVMGHAGGAAAGTALTMAAVLAVSSLHFLRANNHLRFVRHWSWRDLAATCAGSSADATIYLCWGLLILIVNKFTVVSFGEHLLPVIALAASVIEFSIVFDGVGEALIPLGGMYVGERNQPALRTLAGHAARMATLEGLVCGTAFFAFAPTLAGLYGIRGEAAPLLPQAVAMIRFLAVGMPFMGFLMMANTHFLVIRHVPFAVSVTVVKDLALTAICALSLGALFGFDGLGAGFALGYALAAVYPFAFVRLRHGREAFPWLLPPDDGRSIDFAVRLGGPAIVAASNRITAFLAEQGVSAALRAHLAFVVEEMACLALERNATHPPVAEYFVTLDRPGEVRLIVRDTGRALDVTDTAHQPDSRRTADLAHFLTTHARCRYLNTLNCNRTECAFDLVNYSS